MVVGRKFAITSGFLGITYASGAKLLLAGPAVYEVESATGGFLSLGTLGVTIRLRARNGKPGPEELQRILARNRILFSVRTPSSMVASRTAGDYRVVVAGSGSMLYVVRGKVLAWAAGSTWLRTENGLAWKNDRPDPTVVYGAGKTVRFSPKTEE